MDESRIRKHPRGEVAIAVTLRHGGVSETAITKNLSVGGAFVLVDPPHPVGTELEVELDLPSRGKFSVMGVVRKSINVDEATSTGTSVGISLEFVALDGAVQTEIEDVLDGTLVNQGPEELTLPDLDDLIDDTQGDGTAVSTWELDFDENTDDEATMPTREAEIVDLAELSADLVESVGPQTQEDDDIDIDSLQEIDDDTGNLMELEPLGPESAADVVLALRAEADRMQNARFEDRLGVGAKATVEEVSTAFREVVERVDPRLFVDLAEPEIERLLGEITELAVEAKRGLQKRARERVEEATEVPGEPPAPDITQVTVAPTEKLYQEGLEALALGHHKEAVDLLTQAHKQEPRRKDIEVSYHLAFGALKKQYGRYEKAMAHFRKAAELDERCLDAVEELRSFNKRDDRKGRRFMKLFQKKSKK